jgi:hypothetical protein
MKPTVSENSTSRLLRSRTCSARGEGAGGRAGAGVREQPPQDRLLRSQTWAAQGGVGVCKGGAQGQARGAPAGRPQTARRGASS